MKHKIFSLLMTALVAVAPLFAQNAKDKEENAAEPATGVRFVNASPGGVTLPAPLYCKAGKTSRAIYINSRIPSSRVRPIGSTIELYDKDPGTTQGKTASAAAQPDAPKPVLTLEVPADMTTGKVLCILVPTDKTNPYKVKAMYVRESAFPKSGVHIINFTGSPLQMKLSAKGDFSDSAVSQIGAYKGGVTAENTWSSPAGYDGQQYSFILSAAVKGSKDLRRIKASRFSVSSKQSQINLVVKMPDKDFYKLLTIQLNDREPAK